MKGKIFLRFRLDTLRAQNAFLSFLFGSVELILKYTKILDKEAHLNWFIFTNLISECSRK